MRWNWRHSNRELPPFSGKVHEICSLGVRHLLQLLRERNLSKFDICFVQISENDIMYLSNHQLMYALVDIVREFQWQCSDISCLVPCFIDCQYNKRARRLNKVLRKLQKHYLWEHGPGQKINNDVIDFRSQGSSQKICRASTMLDAKSRSADFLRWTLKSEINDGVERASFCIQHCRRTFISCQELLDRLASPLNSNNPF